MSDSLTTGQQLAQAKQYFSTVEQGVHTYTATPAAEIATDLYHASRDLRDLAAASGLDNIAAIARRLEESFQVMQMTQGEPVSPELQSLLQRATDTLKGLLEMQEMALFAPESSYLTEDVEREVMAGIAPVLDELQTALGSVLETAKATLESPFAPFIRQVREELATIATLASGSDAEAHRAEVQARCQQLRYLGEREGVPGWGNLLETARTAIARSTRPLPEVAEVASADLRRACDLLLEDRPGAIGASADLRALANPQQTDTTDADDAYDNFTQQLTDDALATIDDDRPFAELFGTAEPRTATGNLTAAPTEATDEPRPLAKLFDATDIAEVEADLWGDASAATGAAEGEANRDRAGEVADLFADDLAADEAAVADWLTSAAIADDDSSDDDSSDDDLFADLEEPTGFGGEGGRDGSELDTLEALFADEAEDTFIQVDADAPTAAPLPALAITYYPEFAELDDWVSAPAIAEVGDFAELEALLEPAPPRLSGGGLEAAKTLTVTGDARFDDAEFRDLESLLPQPADAGRSSKVSVAAGPARAAAPRSGFEQTLKVPVKLMDGLSNLMGELVVNRNNLEQDQERLRRFLDNLLEQVQNLNDLGGRMQDLYERSLLESSLLASKYARQTGTSSGNGGNGSSPGGTTDYDPLEMDRFTGFHLISQEMMEMIVRVRESSADIEFLVDEVDQGARTLRQVTTQMQEDLTKARMVPFSQIADRLPRAVRDIARKLNKQAELAVNGTDTLVDKMILEQLYDPLTHLVNNAITHGIEYPDRRQQAGKPAGGTIEVRALHQGNQTLIAISDDGAGIDPNRVREKAIEKGLVGAAEARDLSDMEVYDFIFHPGFSTKDRADDFAGRGVGMDVVRSTLSKLRGTIAIDSTPGQGTTFTIGLPLTLSITKALCCVNERARIAFPMDGVEGMFEVPVEAMQARDNGDRLVPWQREDGTLQLLPFKPLSELLAFNRQLTRGTVYGGGRRDDGRMSVVVLRSAGNMVAVEVDRVIGEQEIVIKQLRGPVPKPAGIAGATVLGDGSVMAIADAIELVDLFQGRIRRDLLGGTSVAAASPLDPRETLEIYTEPTVLIVDDSITVRELLSMSFTKSGYRVEQARDGQEAWEKLRSGMPCDIVFCDIEMPRMDGLELLSRLHQDEELAHIPVGMLTSRGADRHRQMAAKLGARGYFTKPYLEEVLLDAAERMIAGEVLLKLKPQPEAQPQS